MASTLHTLIRLEEAEVDARKRRLHALMRRADDLERYRREFERERLGEQRAAAADPVACDYGSWATAARERQRSLDAEIEAAHRDVSEAVEAVAEAWRRQRSLELAQAARERRSAAANARAEQAVLDEQALDRHRRRAP